MFKQIYYCFKSIQKSVGLSGRSFGSLWSIDLSARERIVDPSFFLFVMFSSLFRRPESLAFRPARLGFYPGFIRIFYPQSLLPRPRSTRQLDRSPSSGDQSAARMVAQIISAHGEPIRDPSWIESQRGRVRLRHGERAGPGGNRGGGGIPSILGE